MRRLEQRQDKTEELVLELGVLTRSSAQSIEEVIEPAITEIKELKDWKLKAETTISNIKILGGLILLVLAVLQIVQLVGVLK